MEPKPKAKRQVATTRGKAEPIKKRPGARIGATKDAPTDAEIESRRAQIATLLAAHQSRQVIAEVMNMAQRTVDRDIAAVKEAARERASETMQNHFADELARLDELGRRLWQGPLSSKVLDLKAFDRALRLYAQRCKLLGLDRPLSIEITGAGGQPLIPLRDDDALLDEIDRLSERLAAMPRRPGVVLSST